MSKVPVEPRDWRVDLAWTLRSLYSVPKNAFANADAFNAIGDTVSLIASETVTFPRSEIDRVTATCKCIAAAIGLPASTAVDNPMLVLTTARAAMSDDPEAVARISAALS